jgi:DNA-binding transcriptional MocR family regulator
VDADASQIALTTGGQHAFVVALGALAGESRVVLSERYCYPGFIAGAELLGLRLEAVGCDEHGMLPEQLVQRAIETRARVVHLMPTLHSARPVVMPEARRRDIAEAARKAKLTILEDGVFDPLLMGDGPPPIWTYAPERTVYLTAFEKILPSVLQVGALVVPEPFMPKVLGAIRGSVWGASPLVTGMLTAMLDSGEALDILRRSQAEVGRRREVLLEIVQPYASVLSHPSAYHAWITLGEQHDRVDIAAAARSVRVRVVVGSTFSPSPVPEGARSFRVSLVRARDIDELRRGLHRLMSAIAAPTRPELSVA